MKTKLFSITSALLLSTAALAAEPPEQPPNVNQAPGWQPPPATVEAWADRCTDSRMIGWGFKDPKNFVLWSETFSDPAIYLEFARRMEDPESYARMVELMLEPETAKNLLEWSDPIIYAKWSQALADPNFVVAALRPLVDPNTYLRWMALPFDQRAWYVGLNVLNPGVWLKWSTAPVNPKILSPLVKAADVNTSLRWLQAAVDPANYKAWSPGLSPQPTSSPAKPLNSLGNTPAQATTNGTGGHP